MDGTTITTPNIPAVRSFDTFDFVPIGDQVQRNLYAVAKKVMSLTKGWSVWARNMSFPALIVDPNGEMRYSKYAHTMILGDDLIRLQSTASNMVRGIDLDLVWAFRNDTGLSRQVSRELRFALFDLVRKIQDYKRVVTISQSALRLEGNAGGAEQLEASDVLGTIYILCGDFDNSKVGWHRDQGDVVRIVNGRPSSVLTERNEPERDEVLTEEEYIRPEFDQAAVFGPKTFHRGPFAQEAGYREMNTSIWLRFPRELVFRENVDALALDRYI